MLSLRTNHKNIKQWEKGQKVSPCGVLKKEVVYKALMKRDKFCEDSP